MNYISFTTDDSVVSFSGKQVTLPTDIIGYIGYIGFNSVYVFLLSEPKNAKTQYLNVCAYDVDGNQIWSIKKNKNDPFVGLTELKNGKIRGVTWSGGNYFIDPANGSINFIGAYR